MLHLTSFFTALLFSLNIAFSQSNFSESFTYFPKNSHVYIPSTACLDSDLQSSLIYKTYIGKLSIIRTYYADLNMDITSAKSRKGTRHIAGLGFYNDREGDFFHKTRVLLRYAMHVPLKEQVFLSLGSSIHIINYRFDASATGVSGSDLAWSGSISTALYTPTYIVAASFNDFNNPKIKPINYPFSIYRYVTLYGQKTFDLNSNTQLSTSGRCHFALGNTSSYFAHVGLILSKIVGVNTFYHLNKAWGLAFDINAIKIKRSLMDLSIAYQIPQHGTSPSANQYELNLRYYFEKQK